MSTTEDKKLGVVALAALVVSAMIGGGIFSLPQNMAQGAAVGAVLLAWVITGVGMFFLANTFRILSDARPDASTGIYAYARLGFGKFAGFQMAWGYWLCNIFGNVGYAVLLMDAFDYFFPGIFTGGNNIWSIIGGSCVIWLMNWAVLRGVNQAAFVNIIGTIFKIMPILLFIIIMLFCFRWKIFTTDMGGNETNAALHMKPLGSMLGQIKSTMLVTLWAFIGIEGAVVVSGKARSKKDVGKATVLGFLICLTIYFLLSVLPFGRLDQPAIAGLSNPSTAPILSSIVGHWGGWIMNLGVIIALMTSWLAFTIMIAQIPYAAAMDGTFPKIFRKENKNETPSVSLIVTSIIMQAAMILVYFANNAWNTMLSITGVMILPPYLACTAYLWKICVRGEYPEGVSVKKGFALFCGIAGTIYAIWMIYAAGLSYLFMALIFMAAGIPLYIRAYRERAEEANEKLNIESCFTKGELICALLLCAAAVAAIICFATKIIKL